MLERQIIHAALCSVVPLADHAMSLFFKRYFGIDVWKIESTLPLGIRLQVDQPSEVGADRIVNAAAAARLHSLPAVIVDFGTATTLDVVDRESAYLGGAILPGVRLGIEGLGGRTAKLPLVDVGFPSRVIGKSTVSCIQSGVMFGYCDMICGLLNRIEAELGSPFTTILTGGLSGLFQERLGRRVVIEPNLTLSGIALLHAQFGNRRAV